MERGIPQAMLVGALGFMFTGLMQARGMVPQGAFFTLLGAAVGAFIGWGVNRLLLDTSARAASSVYAPTGNSTAYAPTFSHIETLEVRGDLEGAARAWDEALLEHSANVHVRVRVAEFHLRKRGDDAAAAAHYRAARDLLRTGTPNAELQRYVGLKLAEIKRRDPTV